jgi:PIN domain nuclease of toxin-antitoxin system
MTGEAPAGEKERALRHRGPFDRRLVAQAMVEPAILCTADPWLEPCSERLRRT